MNSTLEETSTFDVDFGDMSCQFNHSHGAVPASCRTCLVEVTHLVVASCGREEVHLCDSATNALRTYLRAGQVVRCKRCKEPPSTHWTVRPI